MTHDQFLGILMTAGVMAATGLLAFLGVTINERHAKHEKDIPSPQAA